ncbi:MAG TPA: DUF2293 domain-containing protein [Prolixibacteraceae bacterium]
MRIVKPSSKGHLIGEQGEPLVPPADWSFLPAGDAGVTRKVTSQGQFWRVEVKKGRRTISLGIWAPSATIAQAQAEVQALRLTEGYQKKRVSELNRREKKQELYDAEFCRAVEGYLDFHERYKPLEQKLARAVTVHAIPVGSGTVARTQLIPLDERAAHVVIAWMRHQTTAYDHINIARVKGERRAVRREFAQQSVALLANYREGRAIAADCPLQKAMNKF